MLADASGFFGQWSNRIQFGRSSAILIMLLGLGPGQEAIQTVKALFERLTESAMPVEFDILGYLEVVLAPDLPKRILPSNRPVRLSL